MKVFATMALLGMLAMATATDSYLENFNAFKAKYNKEYAAEEHDDKFGVFKANWDRVAQLNSEHAAAGGADNVFGMSPFLDMTPEEFKSYHNLQMPEKLYDENIPVHKVSASKLRGTAPLDSVDWRAKGCVTPIKNQQQCGSCWAFSTTESIESANCVAGNQLDELSVEQIVDCDTTDQACNGGMPSNAFKYVIGAGGLMSSSSYPYTAGGGTAGSCQFQSGDVEETIRGWSYATQSGSETAMADAMAAKGPLSIVVDASTWQYYTGGVMSNCGTSLDHAVQAVGYDTSSAVEGWWDDKSTDDSSGGGGYWIVRNSWGTSWGEAGYIRLAYGKNTCGCSQVPTYAEA